jgi:protein-S-isoprenylcysteine O-methyltransferase Ste14
MSPGRAIIGLWVLWALSWFATAPWSAKTEKRAGMGREWAYRLVTAVGVILFAVPADRYEGHLRLWHLGLLGTWTCVAFEASGFAFCWWARMHLGRLWSSNVTKKQDHHVVDTGPYALVRHPIYTGILLAVLAVVLAKGTVLGLLGAALITAGLVMKARLEETWLHEELGPSYDAYRQRVPMLVPFLGLRRRE